MRREGMRKSCTCLPIDVAIESQAFYHSLGRIGVEEHNMEHVEKDPYDLERLEGHQTSTLVSKHVFDLQS